MEDEFDVNAAVDEIGSGLGFSPEEDSGDVELKVEPPKPTPADGQGTTEGVSTAPSAPTTTEPSAAATTTPPSDLNTPPKTWRPEAASTWAALPEPAKQEILKREADIFKGIEGYRQDATIGKALRSTIDPYVGYLQSRGIPPMEAVRGLMQSHYTLATGTQQQKIELLTSMARSYGVEISAGVALGTVEPPPYIDPAVAGLQKELQAVKSQLSETERYRAEQIRVGIRSEVDTFAQDPAHPHFDEVSNEVAFLLQSGKAGTLKDAYEQAIWLNPAVRNKVISAQRQTELQDSAAKVAAARTATSANVRTRARSGSTATPSGTIDDTIAATLASIRSRS